MSSFTIEEVLGTEEFTTANGSFIAYNVRFSGEQGSGEAQHNRKAASPPPQPGEVIDAEIIHKGDRVNLKRIWGEKPRVFDQPKLGHPPKGEFRSPEQIMMGDAIGKALHWCDIKVAAGEWQPMTWEQLEGHIDKFYEKLVGAQKP